ncbi:FxLYD domain-containing protein [Natrinema gelatinilyticum]|uniref:FxLYD domain-containing protein n=1 Tax=Natrinema gelatinilyticum TaxID=2961571 RepID=UPI0020C3E139|nr:FxLYD domain-containing protein [Natrinema gelatinilyticum]
MKRRKILISGAALVSVAGCAETETSDQEPDDTDDSDSNTSDQESSVTIDSNENTSDPESGDTDDSNSSNSSGDGNGSGGNGGDFVELQNHEWYEEDYSGGVRGKLKNISGEELGSVTVSVYFLNSDGTQLDEGIDFTNNLAADQVWEFDATFQGNDPSRVADYEIETTVTNL